MMVAANPNIPDSVNYFIVEQTSLHDVGYGASGVFGSGFAGYGSSNSPLGGAFKVVGIDSKKAIRKVTYSGAAYSAIEQYVLRRSQAMRFDYSETYLKMYQNSEGFILMQL
jgi:hypothetical protein